jgi:hypothetical protein
MSYDLDELAQKYSLQIASIRFATTTNLGGTILIGTNAAGMGAVIHAVYFQASAWAQVQIDKATGGSTYWSGFAGQTPLYEPTRIPCDGGTAVFCEASPIATNAGSGVLRVWFTWQRTSGGASL